MDRRGELYKSEASLEEFGDHDLPEDFWEEAVLVAPAQKTSVHLKLDRDVFEYFKAGGKGHLSRMQAVLKSYVEAQKRRQGAK